MTGQVRAVCFPHDDDVFVAHVEQLIDVLGEPMTAAVEALLREQYPLAVVSPRHQVASVDGGRVWYVFRDGAILPAVIGHAS